MEDTAKILRIHPALYTEQVLEAILVKLRDALGCDNGSEECPAVHMIHTVLGNLKVMESQQSRKRSE
ncbi:MAG: hypothetical protein ABSB83_07480 [Methanomassiliicoccales archaeon]